MKAYREWQEDGCKVKNRTAELFFIKENAEMKKKTAEEIMTNGTTEMVFILDRSASMTGLASDTIRGINSIIEVK